MDNKIFKVVKIASTVLTIGSTLLSLYVDNESSKREIKKTVETVINQKKGS